MESRLRSAIQKRLRMVLSGVVLWLLAAFLGAGTIGWWAPWLFTLYSLAVMVGFSIKLIQKNPEVIIARSEISRETAGFEKIVLPIYALLGLGLPLVAGLDVVRYQHEGLPLWVRLSGLLVYAFGYYWLGWAMLTNPYLEQTVRVQRERGHQVITGGPYAIVRHPMYLGVALQHFGTAFFLGSWWGVWIVFPMVITLMVRIFFEEQALRRDLEGYTEYTQKTRYRLVPGLW